MWGRHWTYAHNGQLKDFTLELPVSLHIPVGQTDSEHAFCWLLDQLHYKFGKEEPDALDLYQFVATLCEKINTLGVFNLILSDGQHLFAFCSNNLHWITRRAPFGLARLIDAEVEVDFHQVTTDNDIVTVIATQPLTSDEEWYKMTAGEWQLFHLGESIATGKTQVSEVNKLK